MKKLVQMGLLSLLALVSGLVVSALISSTSYAADGLGSLTQDKNCNFAYNTEKTAISVSCKTIKATDDDGNEYGDPGDVTFGPGVREFKKKSPASKSYTLDAKYSPTNLSGDTNTCSSEITVDDPTGAAAKGTISGDFIVAAAQSSGEGLPPTLSYSCKSLGSADIAIRVGASNDNARRNAAWKALQAAIQATVDKVCPVVPPAANNQECVDNWNSAVKTCHNTVWAALSILIAASVLGDSDYGTMDNLTEKGKQYYLTAMRNCLKNVKTPLGQPMFTSSEIRQVITASAVDAMASGSTTAPVDEEAETDEDSEEDQTTCAVDGVGWIICPMITFLGKLNDSAFGFLNNLLEVRPALFTDEATRTAWSAFRDLANVAFVVAFLFIVYSQVTGVGVSNYGVKKLLPRIFVAALLVNLSFWICALAVDLSNIVGGGSYQLLKDSIVSGGGGGGEASETWSNVVGWALTGTAVILLLVVIVLAPTVLLAVAVILLILVARQALVIMLVVVAPLAFVAYLLPNTEDWFKKWRKAFVATLMVYPIIGVVFGASTLASNILMNVANQGGVVEDAQLLKIVALAVMAVPLFAVPVLLKGSISAAGAIGARLSGMGDRANGLAGKGVKQKGERLKNRFNAANVARSQDLLEKSGGRLGARNSRRRRLAASFAGLGSTRAVNNEQKDKYAKVAADATARDYVAERASKDEEYARRLAGGRLTPGSEKMGGFVQSYAVQAKREEQAKDIKAAREKIAEKPRDQLLTGGKFDSDMSGADMAAHAAEIASRGAGWQYHQALNASAQIADEEKRRQVQKALLDNKREDHFGLADEDLGDLAEGLYGVTYTDSNGTVRAGKTYEERLVERAGKKLGGEKLAGLKKHDIEKLATMAENGKLDQDPAALQSLADSIADARSNENIYSKLSTETKAFHEKIMQRATAVGITPTPPPTTP